MEEAEGVDGALMLSTRCWGEETQDGSGRAVSTCVCGPVCGPVCGSPAPLPAQSVLIFTDTRSPSVRWDRCEGGLLLNLSSFLDEGEKCSGLVRNSEGQRGSQAGKAALC